MKTESNICPADLEVKKVGDNYEIIRCQNITEKQVQRDDGPETIYEYDMKLVTRPINTRDDAVAAFVQLEYTRDDEFSLINKGIVNQADPEYIQYRNYVAWCKEQANVYFG